MASGKKFNKLTQAIRENAELSKAEVLLAANSIVDELQRIIKKVGELQNESLPAIVTKVKTDLGVDVANQFTSTVEPALSNVMDAVRSAQDQVDNAVLVLSGDKVPMTSISSDLDSEFSDMNDSMDGLDDIEADLDDMDDEALDDVVNDEPLGRARKESRVITGKKLNETTQRSVTLSKAVPAPEFAKFEIIYRDGSKATKQRTGAPTPHLKQELALWAKNYNKDNRDNPIVNIKLLGTFTGKK